MTKDGIVSSIQAICAPTPECRKLRDQVIEEIEVLFEALNLASTAFAKTEIEPTLETVALVQDKFIRRAQFTRESS